MVSKVSRSKVREEKHRRMRRHIIGTPERPRMAVFRSNNHMYVQIIDDVAKTTLVSASTLQKDVKEKLEKTNDVAAAAYLGTVIAKKAQEAGIKSVERMTLRPAFRAASARLLTVWSVSAKYWRRSEWPTMTYSTPRSSSMSALISPVNAPDFSK